jgi:hypothetical protein
MGEMGRMYAERLSKGGWTRYAQGDERQDAFREN